MEPEVVGTNRTSRSRGCWLYSWIVGEAEEEEKQEREESVVGGGAEHLGPRTARTQAR